MYNRYLVVYTGWNVQDILNLYITDMLGPSRIRLVFENHWFPFEINCPLGIPFCQQIPISPFTYRSLEIPIIYPSESLKEGFALSLLLYNQYFSCQIESMCIVVIYIFWQKEKPFNIQIQIFGLVNDYRNMSLI